ncbi:uncharacterized protein LOC120349434 [Nilaparvata lugens]|uniref:uncharacterized protein LOC120349434 n=1 Tax=Nilaparvata lugens TaxID=108931 RepID=UPI00193C992F|nr:uncharacterized protein LOC120349434 [Nilaparvata lugens]XP_039275462.1 uncharacterized protein LOC120349434 [Nilaparvata lugens]XP_039275463.1 uncharacterized protein LOC120349434 [Nilaparvata lugens]
MTSPTFLMIFLAIGPILLLEASESIPASRPNEIEAAFDKLAEASLDAWKDVKRFKMIDEPSSNTTVTGRGKKVSKMAVPLMFGFKFAGVVIAALTALKILLVQSLMLSKVALIGAVLLAGKVVFDHMHRHLYKVTDISHAYSYTPSHPYSAHLSGLESTQYEALADPAPVAYSYYNPSAHEATYAAQDDLQSQYGLLHTAQSKNFSRSAADRFFSASNNNKKKVVAVKTIIKKTTESD